MGNKQVIKEAKRQRTVKVPLRDSSICENCHSVFHRDVGAAINIGRLFFLELLRNKYYLEQEGVKDRKVALAKVRAINSITLQNPDDVKLELLMSKLPTIDQTPNEEIEPMNQASDEEIEPMDQAPDEEPMGQSSDEGTNGYTLQRSDHRQRMNPELNRAQPMDEDPDGTY